MKGNLEDPVGFSAGPCTFFPMRAGAHDGFGCHMHMEDLARECLLGYTPSLMKSRQFGLKSLRLGKELEQGYVITARTSLYFIPQLMDQWEARNVHKDHINYGS